MPSHEEGGGWMALDWIRMHEKEKRRTRASRGEDRREKTKKGNARGEAEEEANGDGE
jgi:hypothetical protein